MATYDEGAATRAERIRWWEDARFGMFVHWGLYSQLGRHEWVMNRERIPKREYEKLADTFKPKPRPARDWARLAKKAGMKYMVMTTKHHEGFCLWDTEQTDYNAAKRGPGRDLVREYVEACREFGLKIGFYYSLMDWHHPDGARCAKDEAARRRFVDFTRGCVRELMTNYGKIDILWYDVSWPLATPELWESATTNAMVRELQPHILINNRSKLAEDFGTPEGHVRPESAGRAWEACMTFNGSWGYMPSANHDLHTPRQVVDMLQTCCAECGNLLLNIGPAPDGSVPEGAEPILLDVGKWVKKNREVIYGAGDRCAGRFEWLPTGRFSLKGKAAYFWVRNWVGDSVTVGGWSGKVERASFVHNGREIEVEQKGNRLFLGGLPKASPDRFAHTTIIKLECKVAPSMKLGAGCVLL